MMAILPGPSARWPFSSSASYAFPRLSRRPQRDYAAAVVITPMSLA
jgi:hypothetical protein